MPDKYNLPKLKYKSMEELKKKYENLQLNQLKPRQLMQETALMFKKGQEAAEAGDMEDCFLYTMKYLTILAHIQKTKEYLDDPKYFKLMLGKKKAEEAVALAEKLHPQLEEAYKVLNSVVSSDVVAQEKIVMDELPDMREKKESKFTLTSAKLFSMLREGERKVLLIDVRPASDFANSRIREDMVNIPPEIIIKGKSANVIEQELTNESKRLWSERGSADQVIFLDQDTNEDKFATSKLSILKEILTKWDINTKYKNEILILDGGYNDWLYSYPWETTNPKPPKPHVDEVQTDIALDEIVYPELDDLNANMEQEFLKPFFDPSKKPADRTSSHRDGTARNYVADREVGHVVKPNFDRAKKAAAIRTYEERKADMANLLSQKEIATSQAIDLERTMIDKERELQDTIKKQKEVNVDEEMKRLLEEKEEKLMIKVEELKMETVMKDNKIRELQEIIEIYEKRDAEEMAKKQEDEERRKKEEEMNARIRMQEEEKKKLEEERMERARDEERRKLEEKYREKLEIARRNKKLLTQRDSVTSSHIADSDSHGRVPTVNRSSKPRYEEKIRQFPGVKGNVGRGLTGLKNLGNTCYMNSIIQCISNNSTLAWYFCGNHYLLDVNRSSKTRGEIAGELAAVIKTLWSGRFRSIACPDLKSAIGLNKPEYATYEQQDSHEFLTFLMDWLHGDLNKVASAIIAKNEKDMNDAEKAWWNFKKKNESLISTLFYGLQRSKVSCLVCGEESVTYEPFSNLSLIIPEMEYSSVEQCLRLYMKSERISGWKCPKCREFREAEKKTDIYKLPSILVVHLKRFHYIEVLSRKRTTFVDFPLTDLNMAQYALSNKQKHVSYNLYAVSNHYGTMEGGHYTAYCKSAVYKKWYKFDDHEVFEISPSEVKTSAAYILFYTSIALEVPEIAS